jgi:UDP-N-acetylmuramate dehydrogenase
MQPKVGFLIGDMTFFGTGGVVDMFFSPDNLEELQCFISALSKGIDVIALGHMSNVIVSDDGFRGCVICFRNAFESVLFDMSDETVFVGAGASINNLIRKCAEKGIACIEEMYCIPGTTGGAIFMNAGTPLFEISEAILSIECMNKKNGRIVKLDKNDVNFEYRKSDIDEDLIITSCILKTRKGNRAAILNTMEKIAKKRRQTQPIAERTCGSTFKNPIGGPVVEKAWQLIARAGCRNMKIGGAYVSDLHCNFIINDGTATSADIEKLIREIKKIVLKNTGVALEEEIRLIGSF